jgi:hypothetical protein
MLPTRLAAAGEPRSYRDRDFRLYDPVRKDVKSVAGRRELGRSAWQRLSARGIFIVKGLGPRSTGWPPELLVCFPSSLISSASGSKRLAPKSCGEDGEVSDHGREKSDVHRG